MNLIFDFGGVVFQWRPIELLMQTWPRLCPDAERARDVARSFFQGHDGDWGQFDLGRIDAEELALRTERRLGIPHGEVLHLVQRAHDHLSPRPDTVAWLERLAAQGHRLFYLSNMPPPMADVLERRHAFMGLFRAGVFSGRVHLAKPDPAVFRLALERFGVRAEEAVFFDDHAPNIEQARLLGLHGVLFEDAAQAARALVEARLLSVEAACA